MLLQDLMAAEQLQNNYMIVLFISLMGLLSILLKENKWAKNSHKNSIYFYAHNFPARKFKTCSLQVTGMSLCAFCKCGELCQIPWAVSCISVYLLAVGHLLLEHEPQGTSLACPGALAVLDNRLPNGENDSHITVHSVSHYL